MDRLRAAPLEAQATLLALVLQGVRWAEDVVDNEFMNKKSSKSECRLVGGGAQGVTRGRAGERESKGAALPSPCPLLTHDAGPPAECCIFHRQRSFGEWSDEEDSDFECECKPE